MTEKTNYSGMTVNEHLFTSGQMQAFDQAARARNRQAMIDILKSVDVSDAEWSVDTMLAHPEKYGF